MVNVSVTYGWLTMEDRMADVSVTMEDRMPDVSVTSGCLTMEDKVADVSARWWQAVFFLAKTMCSAFCGYISDHLSWNPV